MKLDGKVAVVTGAASGIGRASAFAMADAGASVVVADCDATGARRVADELVHAKLSSVACEVDVSDPTDVQHMIETAVQAFGGLDILHNNAAWLDTVSREGDGDVVAMDLDVWDRVLAVNLRGPMLGCRFAIPHMLMRGGGAIVNTSSVASYVGDLSMTAYSASKSALNSLTRSVATAYGKQGIRCNAVAPGVVLTPAAASVLPERLRVLERHHLTPRLGEPSDIAAAVVFLASDDARFITGQVLPVDGGYLSHMPTFADSIEAKGAGSG